MTGVGASNLLKFTGEQSLSALVTKYLPNKHLLVLKDINNDNGKYIASSCYLVIPETLSKVVGKEVGKIVAFKAESYLMKPLGGGKNEYILCLVGNELFQVAYFFDYVASFYNRSDRDVFKLHKNAYFVGYTADPRERNTSYYRSLFYQRDRVGYLGSKYVGRDNKHLSIPNFYNDLDDAEKAILEQADSYREDKVKAHIIWYYDIYKVVLRSKDVMLGRAII